MALRARLFFFIFIFAFCALIGGAPAQTLSFPPLSGRVVDEAGLLDAATRAALTQTLAGLEARSTDQLVVVTLRSLRGTSIEDYGYRLGRAWQVGQKDKNNGVLLIVAPNERKVRIEVGYGLEGTLTDAISKFIIENSILPRFKAGDF
ncbi:MAG: TPM domain-containing protein, partial [Pseudorhodoplanes sp.]|nr:TPM domain-containing protein [Pseudorhodoplanes sp.]